MVHLKSVENVITLGKLIGLLFLFCLPLLSILFLKTKRNDLDRPVMGTIFLVYLLIYWKKFQKELINRTIPRRQECANKVLPGMSFFISWKEIYKKRKSPCIQECNVVGDTIDDFCSGV